MSSILLNADVLYVRGMIRKYCECSHKQKFIIGTVVLLAFTDANHDSGVLILIPLASLFRHYYYYYKTQLSTTNPKSGSHEQVEVKYIRKTNEKGRSLVICFFFC